MEVLRIVLLGKMGGGKSSAANTLLGSRPFYTAASSQGVTQGCFKETSTVNGHKICVVDTPGWTDLIVMKDETMLEIAKCIDLSDPGPHVFLLVLPIGRFTKEEINTAEQILEFFGEDASKYTMVLFTRGDDLEEKTIEEYMKDVQTDLKKILEVCGGRYHVFNNRDKKNHKQVSDLLEKIKLMVRRNEGKHYTKAMYQKTAEQMEGKRKRQKIMMAVMEEECRKLLNNSNDEDEIRKSSEHKLGSDTAGKVSEKREEGEHKPCSEDREGESQKMAVRQNQEMKSHCKQDSDQGDECLEDGELSQSCAEKSDNLIEELDEKFIEKMEKTGLKEKGELETKIQQQEMNLEKQKKELENVKAELQQLKSQVDPLEKLNKCVSGEEIKRVRCKKIRKEKKKKKSIEIAKH